MAIESRNVEVKARVEDLDPVRAKVAALATAPAQVIEQTDTFFVVPRGRLKVRAFSDGSGELISYERADRQGAKVSVYERVTCQEAQTLVRTLGRVLPVRGVVIKRRQLFMVGRTRVHLDDVQHLGSFVELEVVLSPGESVEEGRLEAEALRHALNIPEAALVAEAYVDLLTPSGTRS